MYQGMLHLHRVLRLVVLIVAIIAVVKLLMGKNGKKEFTKKDRTPVLLYMIFLDIQLLVGIYLYFIGPMGFNQLKALGMGAAMKDKVIRFFTVEHTIGMLLAIILVHVANSFAKKDMPSKDKYSKMLYLVLASIALILLFIPWPFREAIGRSLFPGM